jgi:3-dehydroquinate synthase
MKSWTIRFQHQSTEFQFLDLSRTTQKFRLPDQRILWLVDARVAKLHPKGVRQIVGQSNSLGAPLLVHVSESIKSQTKLESLGELAAKRGLNRYDAIGVIGGGALSDLGGFLASTWMRGIPWIVVPTTLLAMVDASIGGKTGVNLKAGKNLVGSIWQPSHIFIDPGFLETLPKTEWRSGMGEVVKYAGLIGGGFLRKIRTAQSQSLDRNVIEACIRYKGTIVRKDERERNVRMYLNLGHTFGHAIEAALHYKGLSHGEAVLIGLLAANRLAVRLQVTAASRLSEFDALVMSQASGIRLPKLNMTRVMNLMLSDKKRGRTGLQFVLLERAGKPIIRGDVPMKLVRESLQHAQDDLRQKVPLTS